MVVNAFMLSSLLILSFLVTLTIYLEIVKYIKTLLSCEAGLSFPYVCSKNRKETRKITSLPYFGVKLRKKLPIVTRV